MTGAVVTIGNFDGVHRGHRYLLEQVVARARALAAPSFAVTFWPHPQAVLRPEQPLAYLSTREEKEALIRDAGVDDVWVCPFTRDVAQQTPEQFLAQVSTRQPIRELWIGHDFAMGRGRSGTIALLAELGGVESWGLHVVPPLRDGGEVISSSTIRAALHSGSVARAALLLGRPYRVPAECTDVEGAVARCRVAPDFAQPAAGTYVVRARVSSALGGGVARVAADPSGPLNVEVELLSDAAAPAVGPAEIQFLERLRLSDGPEAEITNADRAAARSRLTEVIG